MIGDAGDATRKLVQYAWEQLDGKVMNTARAKAAAKAPKARKVRGPKAVQALVATFKAAVLKAGFVAKVTLKLA